MSERKPPFLLNHQTSDDSCQHVEYSNHTMTDSSPMHESVASKMTIAASPNRYYNNNGLEHQQTKYKIMISPPSFTTCSRFTEPSFPHSSNQCKDMLIIPSPVDSKGSPVKEIFLKDDFEVTRVEVTQITRAMQKYHIDELITEEQEYSPIDPRPLSPLSILCPTTNALLQTRVLEEQESSCHNLESEDNEDDIHWQHQFLDLMSQMITYSEELESLSIELLRTEGQVRQFMSMQKTKLEQLEEREKQYMNQLDEYQEIIDQQDGYIDQLLELELDLRSKKETNRKSIMTNHTATTWQSSEQDHSMERSQSKSTSRTSIESRFLLPENDMQDTIDSLRYQVGLWIGGCVGTGHIIHSFENPLLNGLEIIIAGTGVTTAPVIEEAYSQSNTIQHIVHKKHHYMLHINQKDRKFKFALLPRYLWVPDEQVSQCQFKTCETCFSFFQRRHHCRRCGKIICQRHGLNRLPLFSSSSSKEEWYRVCDACFCELIIIK